MDRPRRARSGCARRPADAQPWRRVSGGRHLPPDPEGVAAAAASARELDAVHWSEHLSFNRVATPARSGTPATSCRPCRRRSRRRRRSGTSALPGQFDRPFLIETPASYLRARPGRPHRRRFVAAIAERADCGILLDLHNIWANELNGRQPVSGFLAELPLDRVREVHSPEASDLERLYLDSHVGPISGELLDIARDTIPLLPHVRALIFEAVPESVVALGDVGVRAVLEQLHELADLPFAGRPAVVPARWMPRRPRNRRERPQRSEKRTSWRTRRATPTHCPTQTKERGSCACSPTKPACRCWSTGTPRNSDACSRRMGARERWNRLTASSRRPRRAPGRKNKAQRSRRGSTTTLASRPLTRPVSTRIRALGPAGPPTTLPPLPRPPPGHTGRGRARRRRERRARLRGRGGTARPAIGRSVTIIGSASRGRSAPPRS